MALRSYLTGKTLPLLAIGAIILAAVLIFSGQPDRSLQTPETVPPQAPGRSTAPNGTIAGAGVIEPSSEIADIGTNISGIVTQVFVRPGDRVTRGQPLFAVDNRQTQARVEETQTGMAEARAQIAAADAAIAEAQTNMRTAERQLSLYRQVSDQQAVSRAEVINAEGARENAVARLSAARAQRTSAQAQLAAADARRGSAMTELRRHVVTAPSSGEVLDVDIRLGEYAAAGTPSGSNATPYMQIGETQPLYVRIDVDENEAARLVVGGDATISPRGDAKTRQRVQFVRVEPQIVPKRSLTNSASERVDVRVLQLIYALPAQARGFRVGQQVDAFINAGKAR